jgi:hypothetical protein
MRTSIIILIGLHSVYFSGRTGSEFLQNQESLSFCDAAEAVLLEGAGYNC